MREQERPASGPVLLHLVVHVPGGLEDDALGAKAAGEAVKVYGVDLAGVRLAVDHGREFRELRGFCGIEF